MLIKFVSKEHPVHSLTEYLNLLTKRELTQNTTPSNVLLDILEKEGDLEGHPKH